MVSNVHVMLFLKPEILLIYSTPAKAGVQPSTTCHHRLDPRLRGDGKEAGMEMD